MNTDERKCFDIIAGPGKDLLFDACKYAFTKDAKIPVDFAIVRHSDQDLLFATDFIINGIEFEDGSGYKFNLKGSCKAVLHPKDSSDEDSERYLFRSYYDCKKRSGIILFY